MNLTQYYYLVASLPLLFFDDVPPFSSLNWLDVCREQISEDDYAFLHRICPDDLPTQPGDHPVWLAYSAWETALRNELAIQRAHRLNTHPDPFLRAAPFYADLPQLVKEALGAGSPMSTETALDRMRWSTIDALEVGTQFGLGRLIAYRLKLLLLERKNKFRPESGLESFKQQYTQILDSAAMWTNTTQRPFDTEKRHD